MKNFIEKEIEKVKADIVWYTSQLSKEKAMTKACKGVEGLEKQLEEAERLVEYVGRKLIHFDKMLDVFYTARDLKCQCK